MTQKEQLEEAQQKIETLSRERAEAIASLAEADKRTLELKAAVASAGEQYVSAETSHAELVTKMTEDFKNLEAQIVEKDEKISKLKTRKAELKAEVAQLEGEAKSSDARAREIAARHGATLPDKIQGIGDSTTEKKPEGTPRQRLAAVFQPKH